MAVRHGSDGIRRYEPGDFEGFRTLYREGWGREPCREWFE
jgi:hypothetical protein